MAFHIKCWTQLELQTIVLEYHKHCVTQLKIFGSTYEYPQSEGELCGGGWPCRPLPMCWRNCIDIGG